ncbi:MAG: iron ABC transporter permease [Firmicutes bacterium]|nr:iron ABC transporter permease [Bacillota bacterium]
MDNIETKKYTNARHAFLRLLIIVFLIGLILSIMLAVTVGAVKIAFSDVYRIVIYNATHIKLGNFDFAVLLGDLDFVSRGTMYEIVWNVRMPRVMMGAIVGMLLAMCGVVMQATVQNPLADPYILGISSGASLGATFSIMIGASAIFTGTLAQMGTAFWAFAGALGSMALVMTLANVGGGRITSAKLVLAGCVVGSLCGAFTNIIVYIGQDAENMKNVTYWLMGSMASARWNNLALPGICAVLGLLFFLTQMRTMNTLLLGDEAAITLGVDLSKWRKVYMVLTSLLSAVAVCTCGIVGFVGLMIPHIVRGFVGSDHRFLLPIASLTGGIFLIWTDVLARVIIQNSEIPIGVITSAIGAPIFVYMMIKKSYGFGGQDR